MADSSGKPRRAVSARRALALGTVAVTALAAVTDAAPATAGGSDGPARFILAAGEGASGEGEGGEAAGGEGEGGERPGAKARARGKAPGAGVGGEAGFLSDLGFMTGHLRAGMALYEQGTLDEAKTHMGHPIEEKYDAVADTLDTRGFGGLREQILALSAAAEGEADTAEVRALFDAVIARVEEAREASPGEPRDQLVALAGLTRIAGEEYAVAIAEDGSVGNLHEYQDSWGFLRTVEAEAEQFAASDDPAVAAAGAKVLEQVRATDAAFGDLSGAGIPSPDPSILFGAAARMELAALAVQ